ncbi:hypothetical protein EUX98_g6380 [Antrodiella citrinella]|uniref:Asparaginyl-tRNA synthetase n=1 Tax=Antrodiella citrinella TaxID=2447956 RepID=A0A4S4MR97_9APHY|nr:hypothetical protein EUX98_g6380 [Antrodiella citrinella]
MSAIHINEAAGSDDTGKGTSDLPYQSLAFALYTHPDASYLIRKDATGTFEEPTQSALKKAKKGADGIEKKRKKAEELAEREAKDKKEERERREKLLEDSKKIVLQEDASLPAAKKAKLVNLTILRGQRVRVSGWVHRLRDQKGIIFVVLRDGTGYLQCVLSGQVSQTYEALTLTLESTVELTGTLQPVPEGKTAPGGHELVVDFWKVLGPAPGAEDAFTNRLNEKSDPSIQADLRHLVLRGETASAILKLRAALLSAFRQSHTRRHLSEYTHLEAELAFITFDDLMSHIEAIICETIDRLVDDPSAGALIKQLNPNFTKPARPFLRMSYVDAIKWLNEHGIQHEAEDKEGNVIKDEAGNPVMVDHAVGDDIAEAAERRMTDILGVPMFLHGFPAELKAFYMKKIPNQDDGGPICTESCDLLMPGVGEIVGGSMRIADMEELISAYKREGIDPAPYYWFTDQLLTLLQRFLAWLANRFTVRECSLYPRWPGRATP